MKRRKKGNLEKLDSIISGSIVRAGLKQAVKASLMCYWANEILAEVMPKKTADCSAISYRGGQLKLACTNHLIANQIKLREAVVLEKLNERSGRQEVRGLRFEIRERD